MGRPRKTWHPKVSVSQRQLRRVAGYIRVSTHEQVDGFGLDDQAESIRQYCAARELDLVDILSDEGLGGDLAVAARPGLGAALAMVEAGEIEGLVVKAYDRAARDLEIGAHLFKRLQQAGARFLSITEPELESPLMQAFVIGMAAEEKLKIARRTAGGRQRKAAQGGYCGGAVPYGYQLKGRGREATWVVVENEAAVIRSIVAKRVTGTTFAAIAATLNEEGVPAPRGGLWRSNAIYRIVTNPAYLGWRRWREGAEYFARGDFPPIFTPALAPAIDTSYGALTSCHSSENYTKTDSYQDLYENERAC